MSRLQVLIAQPRMAAGALLTLALAAGAVIGTGADFTAASANPANTFTSGTLTMVNSRSAAAVLSLSNMKPGAAAQTGDVDISNTGSLAGTFVLGHGAIVDSDTSNPLSVKLNVSVTDCGLFAGATPPVCGDGDDVSKYSGTLADMSTPGHAITGLGSFAGGDKHRYRFSVALDSSAGNAYQGDTSTVQFDWNAT
jgi:hypothetical protein